MLDEHAARLDDPSTDDTISTFLLVEYRTSNLPRFIPVCIQERWEAPGCT
jgi:hypothetical protein